MPQNAEEREQVLRSIDWVLDRIDKGTMASKLLAAIRDDYGTNGDPNLRRDFLYERVYKKQKQKEDEGKFRSMVRDAKTAIAGVYIDAMQNDIPVPYFVGIENGTYSLTWKRSGYDPEKALLLKWWGPIIENNKPPLVILAQEKFYGTPLTGLTHHRRQDATLNLDYSGSGEAESGPSMGHLFGHLGLHEPTVWLAEQMKSKESEAQKHHCLFIGSSLANPFLKNLEQDSRWIDVRKYSFGREIISNQYHTCIRNHKPDEKENSENVCNEDGEEFALIQRINNVWPRRSILSCAGLTTRGTRTALKMVCRSDYTALLPALEPGWEEKGIHGWQALIKFPYGVDPASPPEPKIAFCGKYYTDRKSRA